MISIRKSLKDDAISLGYDHIQNFNPFDKSAFCFTLLEGDLYIAMFGSILINQGIHRLWMILSEKGKSKPILYTKAVKEAIKNIQLLDSASRRIEITVRDDFQSGKDWAEMLGFVKEGVMNDYDPLDSMDHVLYYLPRENWDG